MTDLPPPPQDDRRFAATIRAKARRRLASRRHGEDSVWRGLGLFGIVGWSVCVPTLVGVVIGQWIDRRFPGSYSWTLMLLVLGVAFGCWNAWIWIQRQRHDD